MPIFCCVRQSEERACSGVRACVMVKQRRYAVLDALDVRRVGRKFAVFHRKAAVERPPQVFKNLRKCRVGRYAHAARIRAVMCVCALIIPGMIMRPPTSITSSSGKRASNLQSADFFNQFANDTDGAVFKVKIVFTVCN